MSIVNQQLIGGGNFREFRGDVTKDPFPRPSAEDTAAVGFSGYKYAKDAEQNSVFGNSGAAFRGPRWQYFKDAEKGPQYGGMSGSRPVKISNTLLGQLAQFIDPTRDSSYESGWGTDQAASQIAHTIMSSGQMRSLKNTTSTATAARGRPIYHSSGGAFTGYDRKNTYGISSWTTRAVAAVEGKEATENMMASMYSAGNKTVMNDDAVEAVEGVDASNAEIFRPTNDIGTGLRRLPVAPTA